MLPNSGEAPQYQQGTKALLPRVTDNIHSRAISEQIFIQICSLYAATVLGSKSWSAMGTSLGGVQWLRIHLPMQMMQVQSLVEDVAGQLNWHMQQKNPMCCNQDPMQPKKKKDRSAMKKANMVLPSGSLSLAAPPATLYPPTPPSFSHPAPQCQAKERKYW